MGWKTPHPFTDIDLAFPAVVRDHMPPWDQIPDEFKEDRHLAAQTASMWFFNELVQTEPKPTFSTRPGIDDKQAIIHVHVLLSSFEPSHEHKIAAAAMLIDLYFTRITKGDRVVFQGEERPIATGSHADPDQITAVDGPRLSRSSGPPPGGSCAGPSTTKALKAMHRASKSPLSLKAWARTNGYRMPKDKP
jgi:hypothetical protein